MWKKFVFFLELFFPYIFLKEKALCHIDKIDLIKNLFFIHCRGIPTTIKISFDKIIHDPILLSHFSPQHASWIGYYYGRYYSKLLNQKSHSSVPFVFPDHDCAKYQIMMLNRHGDLIFSDKDTYDFNCMHPLKIMKNYNLIMQFNPIEACYIGILSGTSKEKLTANKLLLKNSLKLKVMK